VNIHLIGILCGLALGVSGAVLVAAYMFYTRSSRMAQNQYAIRLGQLLGGGLFLGSLFLLLRLCERIGIHTPGYDLSLGACLSGFVCVTFFAGRAEIRWRRSRGLGPTNTPTKNTQAAVLTPLRRNFLVVLMFGVCLGFPAGFMPHKPVSLCLGAVSWLCFFAILVLLAVSRDKAHMLQLQRVMFVAFACIEIAMLGLFWKDRASSPSFSFAALAAAVMLCIGTAGEFAVLRWTMRRN